MLRIRLRRTGKKHQPYFRIVVAEHSTALTGKYAASVGHYNPRTKELTLDTAAAIEWMNKGAKPSNTVARLLKKEGVKHNSIVVHTYPVRPGKKVQPETAAPAKEPATEKSGEVAEAPETGTTSEEPETPVEEPNAPAPEAADQADAAPTEPTKES